MIDAQLANASRLAGDFRFDQAEQALATAQGLGASERAVAAARQALLQARQGRVARETVNAQGNEEAAGADLSGSPHALDRIAVAG